MSFYSHLQFAPKEIFKKFHMGCQEQIKVPESCLQLGYFLQDAHISYYLWFDVKTCFGGSFTDQLEGNYLLVLYLVQYLTTNQNGSLNISKQKKFMRHKELSNAFWRQVHGVEPHLNFWRWPRTQNFLFRSHLFSILPLKELAQPTKKTYVKPETRA